MLTNYHRSILLDCYCVSRAANRTLCGWIQHPESRLLYRIIWDPSLVGPTDAALSCVLVTEAANSLHTLWCLMCLHCCLSVIVLFGGQEAEMGTLCIAVPHLTWVGKAAFLRKRDPLLSKAELPVKTDAQLWGGCWHGCAGEQRLVSLSSRSSAVGILAL